MSVRVRRLRLLRAVGSHGREDALACTGAFQIRDSSLLLALTSSLVYGIDFPLSEVSRISDMVATGSVVLN